VFSHISSQKHHYAKLMICDEAPRPLILLHNKVSSNNKCSHLPTLYTYSIK